MNYYIEPIQTEIQKQLEEKINNKTKPIGALGVLERIALKIGMIQNSLTPELTLPTIVLFAGDHGIAKEGVSAYPQEVTYQMVLNFLNNGAAINVFAEENNIQLKIVDSGVNKDFNPSPMLINAKIGYGTKSFLIQSAMTKEECIDALRRGSEIVEQTFMEGSNIIGFGEMGIGNTSSASLIIHKLSGLPLDVCVGKGTGLDETALLRKKLILQKASDRVKSFNSPVDILAEFGGFEIAMMTGAFLKAAGLGMTILVDGFITSAAFLAAVKINPLVKDYAFFCHQSEEQGHKYLLDYLGVAPILKMDLRLGEGTGAALAYPVIKNAVAFLNKMASFDSAGVSNKDAK